MNHPMIVTSLAAMLLATGCTTMAPDYRQPALPVAGQFPDSVGATRPEGSVSDTLLADWRAFFPDEQLKTLIELALTHNRDLRVAALQIDKARARYQIQRADLLPSIAASGGSESQRLPGDLSGNGASTLARQYSASVGLTSYEVDFFGRIQSLKDAALETFLATEEARRAAQISLVSEVANAYLAYAADREQLKLARDTLGNRRAEYELVRRRFELGSASALDLSQAQTGVESARGEVARYEALLAQDRNALVLVVGTSVDPALLPTAPVAELPTPAALPAGLPSDLLLRRPDIVEAEHALKAANANIGAARAAFFPSITLTASVGTASSDLSGLFDAGSRSWSFMPQVRLPIFEGGRNLANLRVSEADRDISLAQYEKAIQKAFTEVADTLAVQDTIDERLSAQTALTEATGLSYRLSQARFDKGIDSYLNVLVAQRSDYTARQGLIEVQLNRLANRIALYRALGGGWRS
ncbi:AdeC/AdeK/OprM family multidrug efflux complex outer membrane factor [Laribacter hongkongensis]|uniref:AdeC/AdeK/OprM family multidrug efflux complex outer membrane factor n=1 Tax=Laribacter hongkongensis TaxID=168471 RepID=UPI0023D83A02|nr:AdeC/AdeK/OprM family multidrug efflux complex outer membrane factor [Laribacter hongkongensis]